MTVTIVARAHANVALVKYFGKRDIPLNLPAAPSLSLTLSPLNTETTLSFSDNNKDEVFLGDDPANLDFATRISNYLNIFRERSGDHRFIRISTRNNFPTAAGLASSAAGFAAMAVGAAKLFGLNAGEEELSVLARRGSGSAARSICGGIVYWNEGARSDGSDSFAHSVAPADYWDLRILVGVTTKNKKEIGSTAAMEHTRISSPYYKGWIENTRTAAKEAVEAVHQKDFEKLGDITERSALSMHGALMAAAPPIVYLRGTTLDVFHLTRELRKEGVGAYFTCDAGPQPKILCTESDAIEVERRLRQFPGVLDVIHCQLAEGATARELSLAQ